MEHYNSCWQCDLHQMANNNWGIIYPILIFLAGIIANWVNNKIKIYKERKLLKDTIILWISEIDNSICRYTESLQSLSENISTTDDLAPQPYKTQIIHLNKIDEYSLEKLNDSLVLHLNAQEKSKSSRLLFDYINSINYIKDSQTYIRAKYDEYNLYTNTLTERWNNAYISLITLIKDTSRPLPDAAKHQISLWQKCIAEFEKKQSEFRGVLKYSKVDDFLKSLSLKENNNVAAPYSNSIINDGYSIINELVVIYENFKMNKKYSEIFDHSISGWQSIHTKLAEVRDYYIKHNISRL